MRHFPLVLSLSSIDTEGTAAMSFSALSLSSQRLVLKAFASTDAGEAFAPAL